MNYDTIIIGGGLAGLVAGIILQERGQRTAIITTGQGALHFSSGSMGLLSRDAEGNPVEKPLEHLASLPGSHPYTKVGADKVAKHAREAKALFGRAGIAVVGGEESNHYYLTPVGLFKPTWLSTADCAVAPAPDGSTWGKTAIVGIKGFLDFYQGFVADNLARCGLECEVAELTTPELEHLRKNTTEMRAPGIARIMHGDALERLAKAIVTAAPKAESVIIPAVVGLDGQSAVDDLRRITGKNVMCLSTHPISVQGVRMQLALRRYYEKIGGTYLLGDNVTAGYMDGDRLVAIDTANLGHGSLRADNFILATGSFFSRGLVAEPDRIYEPVFGVDVVTEGERADWFRDNLFEAQPFVNFGVKTDAGFRVSKDGRTVGNLYAVGSILGGCNSLKEGSGAGVAVVTAMEVASRLVK